MNTNTPVAGTWNPAPVPAPPGAALPGLLAHRTACAPHSPAVQDGDRTFSYQELDDWSQSIARALRAHGIRRGDAVAILGARSWEATATMVGVLKAGAVCVPVDVHHPSARTAAMLTDARARLVVALPGHTLAVPADHGPIAWVAFDDLMTTDPGPGRDIPAAADRRPDDCAYILFTSGTTGRPKPVVFPHRAVTRLAAGDNPWCPGPGTRVLQTFGLSFDGSLFETWTSLINGGCLVVAERDVLLDTGRLRSLIRTERITHAFLTTSLFHHAVRTHPAIFGSLDMVLMGGEAMDPDLAATVCVAGRPRHLINGYGPTEGGIMVTAYEVDRVPPSASSIPIGRPVAGSSCYLLRPDGTPAGVEEEAEIYIGGEGLALEYLDRPDETARAFVTHHTPSGDKLRLYRSGDLGLRRADGTLEFRGRTDRQVKVRGFRIELDTVEALLRGHPDVAEAAVLVQGNDGIGKGLAAFVTPADSAGSPDQATLHHYLSGHLPAHALPAPITVLERLPLTVNGKTDHAALRNAAASTVIRRGAEQAAVHHSGDAVADIWAEVLGRQVSDGTGFFAEGGNSLLAAHTVTRTIAALALAPDRFAPLLQSLLATPTLAAFRSATRSAPAVQHGCMEPEFAAQPDFEAEARLEPLPPVAPAPSPQPTRARHILLTGATGFVGAFLLERLLRDTDATLHCPVRAADRPGAMRRVDEAMQRYGLQLTEPDRVHALPADLARPELGLTPAAFGRLADTVDLVLHNAAHVNFLYPYSQLRQANVEAVRTLVRLAGPRRIPFHYVSTTAVLAGSGVGGVRHVDETTPLSHPELLSMGYPETKWVAERMLGHAAGTGLPVTIHRPYEITGHSRTGAWNTTSAICAVFDAIVRMGMAPAVPLPLDLVPVDAVTDAIVGIATQLPYLGGVVHLTNPRPGCLADMVDRMRAAGHRIDEVSYQQWTDALVDHVRAHPTSPIAPFAPLFLTPANQADFSVKEMYFDTVFPEVRRTRTDQLWPSWHTSCPPVDSTMLDSYLSCLKRSGLLLGGA
ncbi:thioester reductase [Streptomyces lydicus]|uniref:Thioester reductase n=1 Tax=Streptomyces lydicus TaxID=47763 RepID=A0A3Q9KE76_9ACTN|nr:amino acid adenylation domain-containing protein [Streptomyces lydicus]AZS75033.1 thioester reductase [Streptomyces lydicus]